MYEVSVERMEGSDGGSRVLAVCRRSSDGVELGKDLYRESANCSDEMEMTLRLYNVSQDDGGIYRCNFSTDAGFSSSLISLTVIHNHKGAQLHNTITLHEHTYISILRLIFGTSRLMEHGAKYMKLKATILAVSL